MAQVYQFVDENGVTRLFAEIQPDPAGTPFNGGTITESLVIAPADKDAVGLALRPVPGASADATDQFEVYDDAGNLIFFVDARGSLFGAALASGNLDYTDGGGGRLVLGSGAFIYKPADGHSFVINGTSNAHLVEAARNSGAGDRLAFFAQTPTTQPVVPLTVPTTQNVIDALVTLGLVAQHD